MNFPSLYPCSSSPPQQGGKPGVQRALILFTGMCLLCFLCAQCSLNKKPATEEDPYAHFRLSPLSPTAEPREEMDTTSIAQLGQDNTLPLNIGTNPEDFNYQEVIGNIPGSDPTKNRWLDQHDQALQLARTQFKPLLVWFSHSKTEGDRLFKNEVLQHEDFLRTASGATLRVKLDFSDTKRASSKLYKGLKTYYGARGFPFLIVALPDGTKINEFKGYRSTFRDGYVQNLVRSIEEAQTQISERQEQLAKDQGYRWWQGSQNRRVFAQAMKYDQESERIALRGMWGEQWIVSVLSLQENDQLYLARWITQRQQSQDQAEDQRQDQSQSNQAAQAIR